jgi:hypothetical protein
MGRQDRPMGVPHHADIRIERIFAAKAAPGQVVRRNIDWVAREIGMPRFMDEVRGGVCHLIQTADRFVVACHAGEIRLLFCRANEFPSTIQALFPGRCNDPPDFSQENCWRMFRR